MDRYLESNDRKFVEKYAEIAAHVPLNKRPDFLIACKFFVEGLNVGQLKEVQNKKSKTKEYEARFSAESMACSIDLESEENNAKGSTN